MPNLQFSGSYFWFCFSLIVLVIAVILVRKQLPHYVNHPYHKYVAKFYKWVALIWLVLILFGNFQITSHPAGETIRGFDNTESVKSNVVNTPKTPVDVQGNFDKAIEKTKKDLDQ